jgi:hypothetical protein
MRPRVRGLLRVLRGDLEHLAALVEVDLAHARVDRHRRHEYVMSDVRLQYLERRLHEPGEVAIRVQHRVELPTLECLHVVAAIADELLEVREQARVRLAAVEQRDLVPACEQLLDAMRPEERRSSHDQHVELLLGRGSRRHLHARAIAREEGSAGGDERSGGGGRHQERTTIGDHERLRADQDANGRCPVIRDTRGTGRA